MLFHSIQADSDESTNTSNLSRTLFAMKRMFTHNINKINKKRNINKWNQGE